MSFFQLKLMFVFFILFSMISSNSIFAQKKPDEQNKDDHLNEEATTEALTTDVLFKNTPLLHHAVEEENLETVNNLLTQGTDPNEKDVDGGTPLMIAVRVENLEIVLALLDKGANPNIKNNLGETALTIVLTKIYSGRERFNKLIQEAGALESIGAKNLLKLTFSGINPDIFLIITAVASYGPCQDALLEKSSGYKARMEQTRKQFEKIQREHNS